MSPTAAIVVEGSSFGGIKDKNKDLGRRELGETGSKGFGRSEGRTNLLKTIDASKTKKRGSRITFLTALIIPLGLGYNFER